jgi:dTDP-4-dehydrorhamnose reductase
MTLPIIAVSGKNGQLGKELQVAARSASAFDFVFAGSEELDITDEQAVDAFFELHRPAFFVNAAAYTAVDKAETDQERALKVNGEAPGYIAGKCLEYNCRFITISTDYVFNGRGTRPYLPNDHTEPVNYYGHSKRVGEEKTLANNPKSIIIRTSWVYSEYGSNFVKTMLRLMHDRKELSIVSDQTGSPTYARDLADAIISIIQSKNAGIENAGIYHYCNKGIISWFDFAVAIRQIAGLSCELKPISSSAYPTPARRPNYSALDTSSLEKAFNIQLKDWRASLETCLAQIPA